MAMLPPVSGVPALKLDLLQPQKAPGIGKAAGGADGEGAGGSFGDAINGAVNHLVKVQNTADAYAQQAATGDLQSVQDYMIASTEAQLTTQLTIAVRNKAVEAYQEIMRMQV
jgi:flagellar hook-basal body complex protein FliE